MARAFEALPMRGGFLVFLGLMLPVLGRAQTTKPEPSIEERLEAIRDRVDEENPYFGPSRVRSLRTRLAGTPMRSSPGPYLKTLVDLGRAEVALGEVASGIRNLEAARTLMGQLQVPPEIAAKVHYELGLAYFRKGETENCCARFSPESCIVPIRGRGVHQNREGSEKATTSFLRAIQTGGDEDTRLRSIWLLNLAVMTLDRYPEGVPEKFRIPTTFFASETPFPRFINIAEESGLATDSLAGGVVVEDFDGDDDLDLVASNWDAAAPLRYLENLGKEGFRDRSEAAGFSRILGGLQLVHADYDNDGDADLLVLRGAWLADRGQHPNSLLQNQGDGTFRDVTVEAGLADPAYPSQTAAWADYDNDGDLDLYVGNETSVRIAAPGQLFRNNGDGTFLDVARAAGVTNDRFCKGVAWGDIDGDRDPDLIVSNFEADNRLYRNRGDGTFEDVAVSAGVAGPRSSFPLWTWDFDNDGHLDIFISSYDGKVPEMLRYAFGRETATELTGHFRGDGTGRFVNVAKLQGLDLPMLTMGASFGDLDNDGDLDFYLGTGEPDLASIVPNFMFRNDAGNGFEDVTMAGGFGHLQKGHAVAFADLTGDGHLDVFQQMGGAQRVDGYRDALFANPGNESHWIGIRLVGKTSNRSAIGARIRVVLGGAAKRSIYRYVGGGSSFGGNPLRQHIGLGSAQEIERLEVFWPTTGKTQLVKIAQLDRLIEITEGEERVREVPLTPKGGE